MFFVASKTLGLLIYPLTLFFIALLLFRLLSGRRQRPVWPLFWMAFLFLWLCSTPWGAGLLLGPLEKPYENAARPTQADVIIVLGGAADLERSTPLQIEFNECADRFLQALFLARAFPQAQIIFSGGSGSLTDQRNKEAPLLREAAIRLGLAPERILVEAASRNTYENAVETKRLVERLGARHIVLITSAMHMTRALGCFRRQGLSVTPYAVDFRRPKNLRDPFCWLPQVERLGDTSFALREYVGLLVYRLRGFI